MWHDATSLPTHYTFRVGDTVIWDPDKVSDPAIAPITVIRYGIGPFHVGFIFRQKLCNCERQHDVANAPPKPHAVGCPTQNDRAHPQLLLLRNNKGEMVTSVSGWYMIPFPRKA